MASKYGMGQTPGTFAFNYPTPGDMMMQQYSKVKTTGGPATGGGYFDFSKGQAGGNVTPTSPSTPGVDNSGGTSVPGTSGGGNDFMAMRDQLLNQFQTPLGSLYNAYMQSFGKGGPLAIPSFQDLYGSYRSVAEKETQRQTQALQEAFGAQGARYGSDILNAQSGLQRDLASNLQNQAGQFAVGLRSQQTQEMMPVAQAQQQAMNDAFNRLLLQYMQQTAPPTLFTGQPPQYQQPTTVLY